MYTALHAVFWEWERCLHNPLEYLKRLKHPWQRIFGSHREKGREIAGGSNRLTDKWRPKFPQPGLAEELIPISEIWRQGQYICQRRAA